MGYFHVCVAGYAAGMFTCFVVLFVFRAAQPALLYLVPGTLGTVMLTGMHHIQLPHLLKDWCPAGLLRGEVVALWHGITSNQHSSHNEDAQDSIPEEDNAVLEVEPLCTLKNDAKDENSDGIEMVAAHEKSLPEGQSHAV